MTRLPAIIFAVGILLAAPAAARTPELAEAWNGAEIAWRDPPSGIQEATRTGKPVIMVFHATWCQACARYRGVFKDPRVVELARDFVMILIDADKDKIMNGAFAPDGTYVPRTIFLDWEGNIQSSLRGSDPEAAHTLDIEQPDELVSLMRKAQAMFTPRGTGTRSADEGI